MCDMHVRYLYRIRPGKTAQRYLARESGMCRYVWNQLVDRSKTLYELQPTIILSRAGPMHFGRKQADAFLTELRRTTVNEHGEHWLATGSSVAQQQLVLDFSKSRAKALKDIMEKVPVKQRAGLPRFKKRSTDTISLNYTKRGFSLRADNTGAVRLHLPSKTSIPVVWSRPLPAAPTSVRVFQDNLGHWYASFVVDEPVTPVPAARPGVAMGIDWGVSETATTVQVNLATGDVDETTAFDLPHHQYAARAQAQVAREQRKMARRRKPKGQEQSHGYRLAKFKAARAQKKVARQRKDAAAKWAKNVVAEHELVAVEDFKPKFLAQSSMAKKAADAAIGATKEALLWQGMKQGRTIELVHPAHTTMDCANCGARAKHRLPLGQRTYTCSGCGVSRSRDKNSAAVMVARAGFLPAKAKGVSHCPAAVLAGAS